MRTLFRLMLGLMVFGLVGGWILRSRVPRERLPLVLAIGFLPLLVHAATTALWAAGTGIPPLWVALYAAAGLALAGGGWWWTLRTARRRPYVAPLGVPAAAGAQVVVTQLLGRIAAEAGAALNVLPGVVLFAASVTVASALLVLLPSFHRRPDERRGPAWLVALGRAMRRR